MRLSTWGLATLALVALAGTAAACEGLSPGDQLVTDGGLCTLAFIVASPTDLYFATAGHCIQVDQRAATPDHGDIGVGAFHFLEPETGSSSDGSPGMDFGLIRISPEKYPDLNPKLCGWDGPLGIYDGGGEGGPVRHYGHGMVFGDVGPATRQREGLFLRTDEDAFYWTGAGVMGDSGSAVLDESGLAIGVFTHVIVGVNGVPPADNGGTLLTRGFELAAVEGFTDLRLVLANEDPVQVMLDMRRAPPQEPPATGTTPTSPASPSARPSPTPSSRPPASNSSTSNATPDTSDSMLAPAATEEDPAAPAETPGAPLGALVGVAAALALARRRSDER